MFETYHVNPNQVSRYKCINESMIEDYFSYFSTKTYAVGTQKNHLSEPVLLSTQNIWLLWCIRKY